MNIKINARTSLIFAVILVASASVASATIAPDVHNMTGMDMSENIKDVPPVDCSKTGGFSDTVNAKQQAVINEVIGSRGHRLHHALWHATRAGLDATQSNDSIRVFGDSWGEEHKFCPPPNAQSDDKQYNPVGEDFLFMHRQMVQSIRAALVAKGLKCIAGWKTVDDSEKWPAPDSDVTGAKSPETLKQLKIWDSKFQDKKWLSTVSLSQVGMALELSTHNNLHMRFATTAPPDGFPNADADGGAPIPFDGKFLVACPKGETTQPNCWPYDDAAYNWLADPYGAALNKTFWKIHGYVDQIIDGWLAANGKTKIMIACPRDSNGKIEKDCYEWKGKWVGDMPAWVDAPVPAEGSKAPGTPDDSQQKQAQNDRDAKTIAFNHERMRRQRLGVIGSQNSSEDGKQPPPRAAAPLPADPFQYAVDSACGKK